MFTREEFFGSEAIVTRPTAEVSEDLGRLAAEFPESAEVLINLSAAEEQLLHFDNAEKVLVRLSEIDPKRQQGLADFYHRRARFADEGKVLVKRLLSAPADQKPAVVETLLDLARRHELKEYLQPAFYKQLLSEDPALFAVFEKLIDRLTQEEKFAEALDLLRFIRTQFPDKQAALLDREVSLLVDVDKYDEAERVYRTAFDPFWTADEADKFYEFLSEHDRLREYGLELKAKFANHPADFDTAIRLAHYRTRCGDEVLPVFLKLQSAKNDWTTEELVTAARLLLRENEGALASRFLYAVYARNDFSAKGDLRSKVLYQIFEMFSDAEYQKLPISNGDLRFYEEIARVDTDPGIATGILSLIFSDTDPKERLLEQETVANKYFNRASAYRIFLSYRDEFPASPELSQMYLDIIRLYIATGETQVAAKTLDEFAEKYRDSDDYPLAALNLAEAFAASGDQEKSRSVYREILDRLGRAGTPHSPAMEGQISNKSLVPGSARRSIGINIPNPVEKESPVYADEYPAGQFTDYLARTAKPVTYAEVLERLVSSLAKEKLTAAILEVYFVEINKYPQAEWLYEQRLTWLEQTNLTEQQLTVYREALNRFQTNTWSDKLARWFVRQKRQADFAELSTGIVARLSDTEIQSYLSQFIDSGMSAAEFDKQLYLQLYLAAHGRFPHNVKFAGGLLRFYRANKQEADWRKLAGEYFFVSPEIRKMFIDDLSEKGELRIYLANADRDQPVYKLFRADAAIRLSDFEQAVGAYRELDRAYPNTTEFAEPLIALTRSFGQQEAEPLIEAATVAHARAEFSPSSAELRTRSGEIEAEAGNYDGARAEWEKLIMTASGDRETYLETATVYWDYFQYEDALRSIGRMRQHFADDDLCAFETGAIREALHQSEAAIREYVKALRLRGEGNRSENAKRRLAVLSRRPGAAAQIESAFLSERGLRKDSSYLSLGYAGYLVLVKKPEDADRVLEHAISLTRDRDYLESVFDFYSLENTSGGERNVLKRLAEISVNTRRSIKYRLQLAGSFEESRDRNGAKIVLAELVRTFPTNYGVITEASDLYHRLGFDTESVTTLQNALAQSRGTYRSDLAARLSRRLVRLDRLDDAERLLADLHTENPADTELFRELAGVYVRRGDPAAMRRAFRETVAALNMSDTDRRELDDTIAELRTRMIDGFTRLKDYPSAVEQHIEIINREPENEDLTENAIAYVKRFGGGDVLRNYYQKTSAEAFKNYRWNVVLARIFEADNDLAGAVRNYKAAIIDQPEMPELYLAAADIEVKQNNFDEALKDIDTVLELTNEDPENISKKIEVLKKAGRNKDAEAESAKLPPVEKPAVKEDQFAAARALAGTKEEEARSLYREAFDVLLVDPLSGDLKASNIVDYVRLVRQEESLDTISGRLWDLRGKLIDISDAENSTKAGEARKRLSILDGAITSSVGEIARTIATDEELTALHEDLKRRVEAVTIRSDQHQTLGEIQDISRRARFGDLEESILIKRLNDASGIERQSQLHSLVNFYNERGAYSKSFAATEQYGSSDLAGIAQAARLVGNREKELEALRSIYSSARTVPLGPPDPNISRYLQLLHEGGRDELLSLTLKSSPFQIQLVNFLLGKGDGDLANAAIDNVDMPPVWKRSRHAEVSLGLRQYGPNKGCRFCDAMRLVSIGDMLLQQPDKQQFPVGDDWFRLGREYGEWLDKAPQKTGRASQYLSAMTEVQPRNSAEQSKLGTYYLKNNDWTAAIEHFRLALEFSPDDKSALAGLGAAYYLAGEMDAARDAWSRSLTDPAPASLMSFFQELEKVGLAREAAERLRPEVVVFLRNGNVDTSDEMKKLIRAVAASFKDQGQAAVYFRKILDRRPTDTSLAEMLLAESLVDDAHADYFYKRLIDAEKDFNDYESDYEFRAVLDRTWTREDAEDIYDQENEYKSDQPESGRYVWEKTYLDALLKRRDNTKAAQMIFRVEMELQGRYARPDWLRLARLLLKVREGRVDLAECERFVGISVNGLVTEIGPPSLERFNLTLRALREEGREAEANELACSYFARMLALGHYDPAVFVGLARSLYGRTQYAEADRILQLMVDAGNESTAQSALGRLANMEIIKLHEAEAEKLRDKGSPRPSDQSTALELAAQTTAEFDRIDAAIAFRRLLLKLDPVNETNRTELAGLLDSHGQRDEAIILLEGLAADRNVSRDSRWQAKWKLHEMGEATLIADTPYDPYSQYYQARLTENEAERSRFLVNSLNAEVITPASAKEELILSYASAGWVFAALKLAETDNLQKSDQFLGVLSAAAELTVDFDKAAEFEKQKHAGGDVERLRTLQQSAIDARRSATDLTIDLENTRKL